MRHRGALASALVAILAALAAAWLRGGDGSVRRADDVRNWLEKITSQIHRRSSLGREGLSPHCSLLDRTEFVVASERVVLDGEVVPAAIVVSRGKILRVSPISRASASRNLTRAAALATGRSEGAILTFGEDVVVGPGAIDAHSHCNEPGREEWEGLATATAAAAAGGVTTLIDMPLNSAPAATSARLLREKLAAVEAVRARGEGRGQGLSADVGLWGGLVPSNARDPRELRSMFQLGPVLGFKAFLSPSGIGDFERTPVADVEAAMKTLREIGAPLVLHAELLPEHRSPPERAEEVDVFDLGSWAASRPEETEASAVREVVAALERVESERPSRRSGRFSVHVAHVAAPSALPLISDAKKNRKLPLTAETCPHYLGHFDALSPPTRKGEKVPASLLKCAPPLRDSGRAAPLLWEALEDGTLDLVASDHSPTTPEAKRGRGFESAWGGVSGLQYLLPATYSSSPLVRLRELNREEEDRLVSQVHRWLSSSPARLAGLEKKKGAIAAGLDADLVAWKPRDSADASRASCRLRHCENSPYVDTDLGMRGRVVATFVRGQLVFREGDDGARLTGCGGKLVG